MYSVPNNVSNSLEGIFGTEMSNLVKSAKNPRNFFWNHLKFPKRIFSEPLESLTIFIESLQKYEIFGISCQNNQLIHSLI